MLLENQMESSNEVNELLGRPKVVGIWAKKIQKIL